MALQLENLDARVRDLMLAEIALDVERRSLYLSRRFTPAGEGDYPLILKDVVLSGGDADLAMKLRLHGCFAETETRQLKSGKISVAKVPVTAPETFAEGEFNRFYLRAVCRVAIDDGFNEVVVYRARRSENPRPESEALIGKRLDAKELLDDLRRSTGVDTCLGLPPGPNSGLSAKLPVKK
jgi:hypothetical protein